MGLRAAIAGYGLAGAVFHGPLIEAAEGIEVAAVMTRSPERAAQARAAHPGARIAESVDDLLADADVLVVATPNASHAELALAGLERGLHVVVDKPMAVTAADARRVVDAAPARVTVFHNRRWDGDFLTAERLVREGALGPVTRFESRFERFRPEIKPGWREEVGAAEGGGTLFDLGPHLVDQALRLFGPARVVHAEVRTRRPGATVDDDAFVAIEHDAGAISHLWMSAVAPLAGPRLRVSGLSAGFGCDRLDPQEDQLRAGMKPGDAGFGVSAGEGWIAAGGEREAVPLARGRYEEYYAGVVRWAAGGAPPVDPADGIRVMEVLERASSAAAQR